MNATQIHISGKMHCYRLNANNDNNMYLCHSASAVFDILALYKVDYYYYYCYLCHSLAKRIFWRAFVSLLSKKLKQFRGSFFY